MAKRNLEIESRQMNSRMKQENDNAQVAEKQDKEIAE